MGVAIGSVKRKQTKRTAEQVQPLPYGGGIWSVGDDRAQDEAEIAAAQQCNPRYFEELRKQQESAR